MGNKPLLVVLIIIVVASWAFFLGFYLKPSVTGSTISTTTQDPILIRIPESDFSGKKFVGKVIDGDTVVIEGESVRLLGMDTDERGYPCFNEAKKRLEELILDEEVSLEMDVEDKDRYGRYLRYIFLDGKNIDLQMVEEGMAVARFVKGEKYKDEIIAAELRAREGKVGCKWREPEIVEEEKEVKLTIKRDEEKDVNLEDEPVEVIDSTDGSSEDIEDLGYVCDSNTYNCPDFSSHAEAQRVFELCGGLDNDVHRLDGDGDGVACEGLS